MRYYLTILLLLFGFYHASAQEATYRWYSPVCEYENTFDSTQFSREHISATDSLIGSLVSYRDLGIAIFSPEDKSRIDIDKMDSAYLARKNKLTSFRIPESQAWQKIRDSILVEVEQSYHLRRLYNSTLMRRDYSSLNQLKLVQSDSILDYYSKALNGTDDELNEAWELLTQQNAQRNMNPRSVIERQRRQRLMDNWKEHAEIFIMTFGWFNRADEFIQRYKNQYNEPEFKKFFTSTKRLGC